MDSDYLKEKIRYYTEWIRLLWIALIALIGGISGILLAGATMPTGVILLTLAGVLSGGVVTMIIVLNVAILRLIEQLRVER